MPEIESLQNSAERCLELASTSNFLEEDVALEAFELLTANNYHGILEADAEQEFTGHQQEKSHVDEIMCRL